MSRTMQLSDFRHLAHRAGFGASPLIIQAAMGLSRKEVVAEVFRASTKIDPLDRIPMPLGQRLATKDLTAEERKAFRKQRNGFLRDLNIEWIAQMASSPAQLREKMTFFWHDHFAARVEHPYGMQEFNNLMRKHALGNFRKLLHEVAKHPIMLQFLNAKQNRKAQPNENFARELMELFTLGTGHYSEQDIKEAARAFTGWSFDRDKRYVFRKNQHDFGQKTFRGKTGKFSGEEIIDMILEDPRTAQFIAEKICRFLVSDSPDPEQVTRFGKLLYESNYEVGEMLEELLLSDWFYAKKHKGAKIKSPIEYLVCMMRQTHLRIPDPGALMFIQKGLGQVLFRPPNVAGWPSGKAWIDSSTLMARMTYPGILFTAADADIELEGDLMDEGMGMQPRKLKKIKIEVDWKPLYALTNGIPQKKLPAFLAEHLLTTPLSQSKLDLVRQLAQGEDQQQLVINLVVQLMSLPEYQLC